MYLIFLVFIILIITIKLLENNSENLGLIKIAATALSPALVTIFLLTSILLFELNEYLTFIELGIYKLVGLSAAVVILFHMSVSLLRWRWKRTLILSLVYITSSVGVTYADILLSS